jgi:hypothetical protein
MFIVNVVSTILAVIMGTIIFLAKWQERYENKEKARKQ